MSKIDHSLFVAGTQQQNWGACPECSASLAIKHGPSGPFIGCSAYPSCSFTKPLQDHQTKILKPIEGSQCPRCQSALAVKKGRYGLFVGCTNYPTCHYVGDNEHHVDTGDEITCPSCKNGHLTERTSRFGKTFFSCSRYPDCKYLVNFTPVAQHCPRCHWAIMVERKGRLSCPQASCGFQLEEAR